MQISENMKNFLHKVFVFFVLICVIDVSFGFIMRYVNNHTDCDEIGKDNYISNSLNSEILVFGSSRAHHHYNTVMMADSLGLTCFNCGEDGYGIILAYGRLLMILNRYVPKMIIYDVTPAFDFLEYGDNSKHLYRLKNFYGQNGIDSIFYDVDPREKIKMKSSMYQHNSSYLRNLASFLLNTPSQTTLNGFDPLFGAMDTLKIANIDVEYDSKDGYVIDSLKLKYLNKFIDKAISNNIKVVFVASPVWYGQDSLVLKPVKEICASKDIVLLDYTNDIKYVHSNALFKDGKHLNALGADSFTIELINELKKCF